MTDDRLTLAEVEQAIYEHYQFFAREAPGVVVQEVGHLANLWAMFDEMIAEEQGDAL